MSLHRLLFDPSNPAESANVGAYLRAGSDGDLLSSTNVGGKEGLDVNVINASLTVSATDLDIRDLAFATDSVDVSGSAVSVTGTVAVTQSTSPWVVSATDLDIRDLDFATDSVDVSNSTNVAVVDGGGSLTVDATNLDIRDITHVSDSIRLGDGTDLITSTLVGAKQALDVNVANSIQVEDDLANIAIDSASETVTTTSGALITSDLADRRFVWLYNNGSKVVYIGPSGVATSDGFPLFPGSILEARIGDAVAIHAVAQSGSQDVRVLQAS